MAQGKFLHTEQTHVRKMIQWAQDTDAGGSSGKRTDSVRP